MITPSTRIERFSDFEASLGELDGALQWFEQFGFRTNTTRYSQYRDLLQRLVSEPDEAAINALYNERPLEIEEAILQCMQIARVFLTLRRQQDAKWHKKLTHILKGPRLTIDENPLNSGNRARNILFELSVIAAMSAGGLAIDDSVDADAAAHFRRHLFIVECKRLQSNKRLLQNVNDAVKQLTANLDRVARPRARGIVIVDASKCLPIDLVERDVSAAHAHLQSRLIQLGEYIRTRLSRRTRADIPAIVVRACVVMYVSTPSGRRRPLFAEQYVGLPILPISPLTESVTSGFLAAFRPRLESNGVSHPPSAE